MAHDWLADVIVINESSDESTAGDVSVYRSIGEACRALEHWWIEDAEGFAFTAKGERLTLGVSDQRADFVVKQSHASDGAGIAHNWLQASATALLEARRAKAAKGTVILSPSEERGMLPTSTEGLVAYIGFSN